MSLKQPTPELQKKIAVQMAEERLGLEGIKTWAYTDDEGRPVPSFEAFARICVLLQEAELNAAIYQNNSVVQRKAGNRKLTCIPKRIAETLRRKK